MATPTDTVRALTGLATTELGDDEIDVLLELTGGTVLLAAALAMETVAGALVTVSASSDDITIDGSKRAAVLMARAARLRAQAATDADDDGSAFEVVPAYGSSRAELTERSTW